MSGFSAEAEFDLNLGGGSSSSSSSGGGNTSSSSSVSQPNPRLGGCNRAYANDPVSWDACMKGLLLPGATPAPSPTVVSQARWGTAKAPTVVSQAKWGSGGGLTALAPIATPVKIKVPSLILSPRNQQEANQGGRIIDVPPVAILAGLLLVGVAGYYMFKKTK